MQNYIKTNNLSLGQHFVFFPVEVEKCQEFKLTKLGEEEEEKKRWRSIKFTFRSAVYVTLISSLFSVQAFSSCCCNPSKLSNKNTIFSVLLQCNVPSIWSHYAKYQLHL